MPRQFFIAPLVCVSDGFGGQECAAKINAQQANYEAACQDASVPNAQCLVLVAGDTSGATADNQLVSLVGENFETTIASLPNNTKNRIQNGLSSKNIPLTLTNYVLVRDFLTALGRWFDPNFSLERFWVRD